MSLYVYEGHIIFMDVILAILLVLFVIIIFKKD